MEGGGFSRPSSQSNHAGIGSVRLEGLSDDGHRHTAGASTAARQLRSLEGAHFDTCLIEQIEGYFVAIVADHQSWSQREHVPAEIPHLPKALDLISVAYGNKPYRGLTKRIGEHLASVGADGLRPDAIGSEGQLVHVHIAAQEGVEQERVPIDHGQHSIEMHGIAAALHLEGIDGLETFLEQICGNELDGAGLGALCAADADNLIGEDEHISAFLGPDLLSEFADAP